MMKRNVIGKGPKDLKKTLRRLMKYLGLHKLALAAVAVVALALWRFIPRSLQGDSGHRPGGGHRHPLYGLF